MIPHHLYMENFLSHDSSEIDFNSFDVALILGSYDNDPDKSNGAGKSAIFEAICWALFGKSRHKKKDGVVKRDKAVTTVVFKFYSDGHMYRITRKRDKTMGESEVMFDMLEGENFKPLTGDTNTATDKKIVSTVKFTYDDFINSVYFKQNDISVFAQSTPSKRKDIIKSLLKLDRWDAYQKKANERRKFLQSQIKEKEKGLVSVVNFREEMNKCRLEIDNLRKIVKGADTDYAVLSEELLSLQSKYQSIYGSSVNKNELVSLQKEYSAAKSRRRDALNEIKGNNDLIEKHNSTVGKAQQRITLCKSKIDEAKGIDIKPLNDKIMQGVLKEQSVKDRVESLSKPIRVGNHCDECQRPISTEELNKLKESRTDKLMKAKAALEKIQSGLKTLRNKLTSQEKILSEAKDAEAAKNKAEFKLSECQSSIKSLVSENASLQREIEQIESRNYKKELAELKDRFDRDKEETLLTEISITKDKLDRLKRKIDRLNIDMGSKKRKYKEMQETEKAQADLQKELNSLNADYAVYDKLNKYFGRDGIQAVIIENVIDELENYANGTLAKMYNEPVTLSVQTQRETDSGAWAETFDIEITTNGSTDEFDTFSGGEQFRISLAIRLALSKILAKRMGGTLGFLLLDEVSSSLDDKGLAMFIDIIKQIGQDIKVMVITHDDALKENFEDIIVVNKTSAGSRILA